MDVTNGNGGATYGGVPFSSVGLLVTGINIPLLPDTRQTDETIDGYDGAVDLRTEYEPRTIEVSVVLIAADEGEYQTRLAQIAKLFSVREGVRPLILDRAPGKRWMCKFNGRIPIKKVASVGEFTLPFKAHMPFSESVRFSNQPLKLGQGYVLGQGLRLDMEIPEFTVNTPLKRFSVYNAGTYDAYPHIWISGAGSNITVTNDTTGESFTLVATLTAGTFIQINCEPLQQTVTRNGQYANGLLSGVFPRLIDGNNEITVTSAGSPNFTITYVFRHTYLY